MPSPAVLHLEISYQHRNPNACTNTALLPWKVAERHPVVVVRFSGVRARFSSNGDFPYRFTPCRKLVPGSFSSVVLAITAIGQGDLSPILLSALVVLLLMALSHNRQNGQPMV